MLKLIGALCVIISTTLTGVMASALLKKRVNLLQGAISMIQTRCKELLSPNACGRNAFAA